MPPPADYVLVNGRVRTVSADDARAGAVAVTGRWITAVGSDDEVRPLIGRGTDVIDLRGREVVPGFNDAHHHFGATLARAVRCGADAVGTIAEIQAAVRRAAAELPAGTWIRAKGYDHHRLAERRHPTRWDLDAAAPEHPVVLVRTCGHMGVVNSRALQLLGIDDTAPDPPGGAYDRVDGRLAGVLFEKALYPAVRAASATRAELVAAMRDRAQACLAMGWTTLQDPGARNPALLPALIEAEREGRLPVRVRAFVELSGMEPHGLALFRGGVISGFGNDRLRIGPCKLMVDGSSSGPTAATRRPYASQPDFSGLLQMSQEELDALVLEGRRTGFQLTMHAVGDRAIEMCLDAFARADGAAGAGDARDRIEHCAMCPPDLVRRVRAQRVIPVVQPTFLWDFGDGYLRDYGTERGAGMFPVRDFVDAGIVVAGSTDTPVSRPEPLFGIQQAVTRLTRGGQVCGASQRIGVAEAVRLFTYGSAYAAREERILGSIEPGKLADLVVLRQGLEDVAPAEIAGIDIDLVMVDGEVAAGR